MSPNPPPAAPEQDERLVALRHWSRTLDPTLGLDETSLRPASNDASFRRYFRIDAAGVPERALIVMDAPPPKEDCRPFVHAARVFAAAGVSVPLIHAQDLDQGFLLLSDFGTTTYLDRLDDTSADALYGDATTALVRMQAAGQPDAFPAYDRALLHRELALYPDWYVARHKSLTLTAAENTTLSAAFETLLANNLGQATVHVHRDYHSRNLMLLPGAANPGILDFQDAVHGPITYDLVSLMRDAYIDWPEERIIDWCVRYWEKAKKRSLPVPADFATFYQDFEWMGLQRHLKVLGIFARLAYRDGKTRYLDDMPRVLAYVRHAARRYNAFGPLARLLDHIEGETVRGGLTF